MGMKNHFDTAEFRHKRVRHKQGRNIIKYKGKSSGMDDHFDTSGVFEISKFDISKSACTFGRPQTILTAIQLPLLNPRLSLLPSNYLWSSLDYPYCHPTTSGIPQTIVTAI